MELLFDAGFDGSTEAFRILLNESMKAERCGALGAGLHERTDSRMGYANGYKPKTVATRMGKRTNVSHNENLTQDWRTPWPATAQKRIYRKIVALP